jgi:hypothetical protein
VSGFQRAEGTRYTYWVAFDKRAEGGADRANLRLYEPTLSVAEVERNLAAFCQDPETNRLYGAVVDEKCRMGEDCGADLLKPGLDFLGVNFPVFHIRPPMSTVGCFSHRVSAFTNN